MSSCDINKSSGSGTANTEIESHGRKVDEDKINNNDSSSRSISPTQQHYHHENDHDHHKDEYLEDPLPDLVGSLKISEEPEPDLTVVTDFVLEDFEFSINTSDEEDDDEDYESSGSDLEFFDATIGRDGLNVIDTTTTSSPCSDCIPETENVSVELDIGADDTNTTTTNINPKAYSKFSNVKARANQVATTVKELVGKRKKLRKNIRVLYSNLDKPYTARVSASQQFKNFLTLGEESQPFGSMSQSSSINDMGSPIDMGMTAEEFEAARQEWQAELNQVEEEIQTLRQVLTAKTRRAHELKRKLGVTAWTEFTSDMGQGIKNVRESTAVHKIEETFSELGAAVTSAPLYQKTESAIKATAEKTTSLLGGIGSAVSQKIGALKNTDSFRSMEERVSSAVSSVKTKMGGSRSGSVQSFDEALREATANQGNNPEGVGTGINPKPNGTPTPVAENTTPDDKSLT